MSAKIPTRLKPCCYCKCKVRQDRYMDHTQRCYRLRGCAPCSACRKKFKVSALAAHLEKCVQYKFLQWRDEQRRQKAMGPPLWGRTPSRATTKAHGKQSRSWPPIIRGGALETNRNRH
jgi:hypothetical protein